MKVVINKGRHYARLWNLVQFFPFFRFRVKCLKVTFTVTESMIVFHDNPDCISDSNKFFGICDGFGDHHKNSFRISYVPHRRGQALPDADCIQVVLYDYVNGEKVMKFLPGFYRVGETGTARHYLPKAVTGRTLPPYHGGDCETENKVIYNCKMEYL